MREFPRLFALAATLSLAAAQSAAAQVPSKVNRPTPECTDVPSTDVDVAGLAEAASKGDWVTLNASMGALRTQLDTANCLSPKDERVIFVFAGKDSLGDRVLHSVVFPAVEPFSNILPGLSGADVSAPQLFEVFVSDRPRSTLASRYIATKQVDPLIAQAISAVSGSLNPILTLAATVAGSTGRPRVPASNTETPVKPAPKSFLSVARVDLSTERASVEVARRALIPQTRGEIVAALKVLTADVRLREARDSEAAMKYATTIESTAEGVLQKCEADQAVATAAVDADATLKTAAERRDALEKATIDCRIRLADEAATQFSKISEEDRETVIPTNVRYRDFIAGLGPLKVEQKTTLVNEPTRRVNIEVLTGFIVTATERVRVKANAGKIVADPLPRVLTSVGVNVAFKKFQPSVSDTMKGLGWYIGPTLTPNLGIATAIAGRIINGLSVNVGVALLAVPTGDVNADAPETGKPFRTVGQVAFFAGMSFNVK